MSHYKPYQAYKDSGVEWIGEVPEHWEVKRLRHVATLNPSPNWHDLEQQQPDYPFLPMDAIGETGSLDATGSKALSECRNGYTYFADGDVVYAKVTPCFENGKGAVIRGLDGGHGFGTTELTVLRPTAIDRDFLYALTYAESYRQPGASEMLGSGGLKRVPDEFARNYRAAIPPPDEQTAIAAALDRETARIDALIEKKTKFIEVLKEKRQALITHAVTKGLDPNVKMKDSGVEWIGEVPEHWAVCKLGYRYSVELGKMLDEKKMAGSHPVPYLRNKDVQWLSINTSDLPRMDISPNEIDRYTIKNGDLLVCEGGDVGRAAIWRGADNVIGYQKALHRLRAVSNDNDLIEFYFYALFAAKSNRVFMESDTKSTISHLPAEKFREYRFAFPPMDEQQIIVEYLDREVARLNTLTEKTQLSINLLKERRSALITAAVTGQIDLREAA